MLISRRFVELYFKVILPQILLDFSNLVSLCDSGNPRVAPLSAHFSRMLLLLRNFTINIRIVVNTELLMVGDIGRFKP